MRIIDVDVGGNGDDEILVTTTQSEGQFSGDTRGWEDRNEKTTQVWVPGHFEPQGGLRPPKWVEGGWKSVSIELPDIPVLKIRVEQGGSQFEAPYVPGMIIVVPWAPPSKAVGRVHGEAYDEPETFVRAFFKAIADGVTPLDVRLYPPYDKLIPGFKLPNDELLAKYGSLFADGGLAKAFGPDDAAAIAAIATLVAALGLASFMVITGTLVGMSAFVMANGIVAAMLFAIARGYEEIEVRSETETDEKGGTHQVPIITLRKRQTAEKPLLDAGWNAFELAAASQTTDGTALASLSRKPTTMEVWWVARDGSVQGACLYEGGSWQRYELAPAGSGSATAGIAAVSRDEGKMEVWWIAPDGSVQAAAWSEGGSWQRYELAPAGSAATDSRIAAVSRNENTMELWWARPDGALTDANWYPGPGWTRFELAPPGSVAKGGGIAAVSRATKTMEVLWVSPTGAVRDMNWYEGGTWQGFELAPPGSASAASGIGMVSRAPRTMEAWWVGSDGSIQDVNWYEGGAWNRFELAPRGSASPNSSIAAVSRSEPYMDVFWSSPDGALQRGSWRDGSPWECRTLMSATSMSPRGGITAVSRIPGSIETWSFTGTGAVRDVYWYG